MGSQRVDLGITSKLAKRKNNIMSATTPVCSIDTDLIKSVKKLTFRSSAEGEAIVMKVDTVAQSVVVDDTLEDISVDELREALPEHEPRFVAYSFRHTHADGHQSYPLLFL